MQSLEQSPNPLVFKVVNAGALGWTSPGPEGIQIRVLARSLEGMQKEAVVLYGPTGVAWRMASDEGPYLNGTDLAPFPLAFFTTGLAASYLSTLIDLGGRQNRDLSAARVVVDSCYTMTGSALKGTMRGDALPVDVSVAADSSADGVVLQAAQECPAFDLLRSERESRFALEVNGQRVPTLHGEELVGVDVTRPDGFDAAMMDTDPVLARDIIRKTHSAANVAGPGGAGSSLASDQKRTLHLRGTATVRPDGLKHIEIELFRPVGSGFSFLSDASRRFGGRERAPSGLAYIAAGLAFCYMTQLGRYASIVRKPLDDYRLCQDMDVSPGRAGLIGTQVALVTPEGADFGRTLVRMGAQTCFLHAACRSSVPVGVALSPAGA